MGELYQHATDQRAAIQREGCLRFLGQQPLQHHLMLGHLPQIVSDQMEATILSSDLLQCLPIDQGEGRTQRCMPRHDAIQRTFQRMPLQWPAQTQATADVICLTDTLELRQEPEPLLCKRQHARCIWCQRHDRRQDRAGGRRHTSGKLLERGMGEQLGHADLGTQVLTQARRDPHHQQRMPAESEEVVVPPDRLQTQQVAPDHRNGLFDFTLRSFIRMRRISRTIRCRQCLAIQLAVGGQRQLVQLHIGRRHHVVR